MIRNSFWLTQTRIRHYFQHLLIRKNNNNNIAIRPRLLRCSRSKMRSLKNIQWLWYFFFFFCELASFSPWSVKEWTTLKILLKLVPWQQKHFRPLLQRSSSEEKKNSATKLRKMISTSIFKVCLKILLIVIVFSWQTTKGFECKYLLNY